MINGPSIHASPSLVVDIHRAEGQLEEGFLFCSKELAEANVIGDSAGEQAKDASGLLNSGLEYISCSCTRGKSGGTYANNPENWAPARSAKVVARVVRTATNAILRKRHGMLRVLVSEVPTKCSRIGEYTHRKRTVMMSHAQRYMPIALASSGEPVGYAARMPELGMKIAA